jgi:outer membrane murein-binding lipoprotein Lpp
MDYLGPFQTKFGKIKILVNDGEVYVTDLEENDCQDGDFTFLTVFGVDYGFSWHIPYDEKLGVYHDGGEKWYDHKPYMLRRDNYKSAETRGAAYNKVCGVVLELVNSGIITQDQRRQARVERLQSAVEHLESRIDELTNDLDRLMEERKAKILEIGQLSVLTSS